RNEPAHVLRRQIAPCALDQRLLDRRGKGAVDEDGFEVDDGADRQARLGQFLRRLAEPGIDETGQRRPVLRLVPQDLRVEPEFAEAPLQQVDGGGIDQLLAFALWPKTAQRAEGAGIALMALVDRMVEHDAAADE